MVEKQRRRHTQQKRCWCLRKVLTAATRAANSVKELAALRAAERKVEEYFPSQPPLSLPPRVPLSLPLGRPAAAALEEPEEKKKNQVQVVATRQCGSCVSFYSCRGSWASSYILPRLLIGTVLRLLNGKRSACTYRTARCRFGTRLKFPHCGGCGGYSFTKAGRLSEPGEPGDRENFSLRRGSNPVPMAS